MGTTSIISGDPSLADNRLTSACDTAQRLHMTLEDLIQYRTVQYDGITRMPTVSHSTPPWNAQIAYLIFDLAQLARTLEMNLRLTVAGTETQRGTSDTNTQLALRALPALAQATDQETAAMIANQVEAWCISARTVIGEVEPLTRLPRLYGESEPRCPWCKLQSLRLQPVAGIVRCVNPVCYDDDGKRPRARVELGPYSGEPVLVWQDGTTGIEVE